MMRILNQILNLAMLGTLVAIAVIANPAQAANRNPIFIESSPLRSVWGQTHLRAEWQLTDIKGLGLALEYSRYEKSGEQLEFKDRFRRAGMGLRWYPSTSFEGWTFYMASGLALNQSQIGHQKVSNYRTTIRQDYNNKHDLWVSENYDLSLDCELGYRTIWSDFFTGSLGLGFDRVLATQSRIRDEQISSSQVDLNTPDRKKMSITVRIRAGIAL